MPVLGIDTKDFFLFLFHGLQASTEYHIRDTIPKVNLVLIFTILPRFALVNKNDSSCLSSQKRQQQNLRCRTYFSSKGILTFFPFPIIQLRNRLGFTNPWLICIVKEPLPFQRNWFSQFLDPTFTRIFISARSISFRKNISIQAERLPTTNPKIVYSIGS